MTTPTLPEKTLPMPYLGAATVPHSQPTAIDPLVDYLPDPGSAARREVAPVRWAPVVSAPAGAYPARVPMVWTPYLPRKSAATGYALLLFFGAFGAHQFYLNRTGHGVVYLLMLLLSPLTLFLSLPLLALFLFVDLFRIPEFARRTHGRLLS